MQIIIFLYVIFQTIVVEFVSFETELTYDVVRVYANLAQTQLIGTFSGTLSPFQVVSTTNVLSVKFSSDGSFTFAGFLAKWSKYSSPVLINDIKKNLR